MWIGTIGEIRRRLAAHQDRWGIARYVVRVPVMAAVERIVAAVGD